ncbi:hypothetical protein BDF19DRAFT_450761 [Syncephalis fuscata]|nr:hypothetical protein BDF19DRAFT_450761 [Syncephalis fuscata]
MPSGLESLLRLLPPADQRGLLLEIGPIVCCQLQQTSSLLFRLIAFNNVLWQQLYGNSFNFEDEKEVEALSVFKVLLAGLPKPDDDTVLFVNRDDDDDDASSNINSQNITNGVAHISPRQIAWWQRAFALRHRLAGRWRKGDYQLQALPFPTFLGHLPRPSASYGPWIVVHAVDHRLYLGDMTTITLCNSNSISGGYSNSSVSINSVSSSRSSSINSVRKDGQSTRTMAWHELPIKRTWNDRSLKFIFSASMNDRYVATVVEYEGQNVLYVWSTTTRQPVYVLALCGKESIDQIYGHFIVMNPPSGENSLKIVDVLRGISVPINKLVQGSHWHLQQQVTRHQIGLRIYIATEQEGIIDWSLLQLDVDTDRQVRWTKVQSGRLELLSNQHRLYETSRIDDHRVLISMTFFEHRSISHIGLHDLRSGTQARVEWSYAISGQVIAPIVSENLLLCHGNIYTLVCLDEGFATCRLNSKHASGLQRVLGPLAGESFTQQSHSILITDVNTGKIVHQLNNRLTKSTGRRYYWSLRASYMLEMFASEPTLYVWNFISQEK